MCGTFANDLQHLVHVQPGVLTKGDGFTQALNQAGNAYLVDHLGELASTTVAQMGESAGKSHGDGLDKVKRGLLATTHDREHSVLCTCLASGHRGVNKLQPQFLRRSRQLASHIG